ncbi:MAG: malonyl-ACP O-methyltransferase BioC [Gammaproteobacteria bacterium]|nr:malonyl-ACP O-methyltransferase BioC [Gammaproteobacteria bacterium]
MDKRENKRIIAKNFSRAAHRYDAFAHLQQKIGCILLGMLPKANMPSEIVDIGSGTGFFTQRLQQHFHQSRVIAVDIAEAMSAQAKQHNPLCITADFDYLPLATNSVNCIFSNFALQWSLNPSLSFAELKRVLAPGGLLIFSSLGPNTLIELQHNKRSNSATYLDSKQTEALLLRLGYHNISLSTQIEILYFERYRDVLQDLKNIGAHTLIAKKPGLLGKSHYKQLSQAYETYRNEKGLPATYDIIIGVAYA